MTAASAQTAGDEPADAWRLAGEQREDTAQQIAEETFDSATDALLVASRDRDVNGGTIAAFADAYGANYLAGDVQGPILGTFYDEVPEATSNALTNLSVDTVHVLGGTMAISDDVVDDLEADGYTVNRISGDDRSATSVEVAEAAEYAPDTAIVAGYEGIDATVAGGLAYAEGYPLLLTEADELNADVESYLQDSTVENVIIVGGSQVVSEDAEADIEAAVDGDVQRESGENRYFSALELADYATDLGWNLEEIGLAHSQQGFDSPDPLTMGPYNGENGVVLLTTRNDELYDGPEGGDGAVETYLRDNACDIYDLTIAGGTVAIPEDVEQAALEAARDCPGNQAFEVTPEGDGYRAPADGERDYTATDFDEDRSVTLGLVDADDVTDDDGQISFADDADPADSDDDLSAEITNVEVDDVAYPSASEGDSVNVDADSTLTFTVVNGADGESVIPVVHDADTGDVTTSEDDTDFGIGGATHFAAIDDIAMDPPEATNPYTTEHTVTATLGSGAGEDFDAVGLEDQQINFAVYDATVGEGEELTCPTGIDELTNADEIELGNAQTDANGQAAFSYTFGEGDEAEDDVDNHCIVAEWDGDADRGYTSAEGPAAEGSATKTWSAAEAAVDEMTVEPADGTVYNETGTTHTITAEVADQYGEPVEGANIQFDIAEDGGDFAATTTRQTDANGEVSYEYTGPASDRTDEVTVSLVNDEGATIDGHEATHTKEWISSGVENVDDGEVFPSIQAANDGDLDENETLEVFGEAAEGGAVTVPNVTVTGTGTLVENANTAGSVLDVQADGVEVDTVTIDGGDASTGPAIGIQVQGDNVAIDAVTVADVTGTGQGDNGYGVAIWNSSDESVANTQVTNSTFDNLGSDAANRGVGIVVGHDLDSGSVDSAVSGTTTISGNTFVDLNGRRDSGSPSYGVNVKNVDNSSTTTVSIAANDFSGAGNPNVAVNLTEIDGNDGDVNFDAAASTFAEHQVMAIRDVSSDGTDTVGAHWYSDNLYSDPAGYENAVGYFTSEEASDIIDDHDEEPEERAAQVYTY